MTPDESNDLREAIGWYVDYWLVPDEVAQKWYAQIGGPEDPNTVELTAKIKISRELLLDTKTGAREQVAWIAGQDAMNVIRKQIREWRP